MISEKDQDELLDGDFSSDEEALLNVIESTLDFEDIIGDNEDRQYD